MDERKLGLLLKQVADGELAPGEALRRMEETSFTELDFAKIDNLRELRTGRPEVIYGAGKTPEQIAAIAFRMRESGQRVLISRASEDAYPAVEARLGSGSVIQYFKEARSITVGEWPSPEEGRGGIAVVTAGTADIPVAEEAAVTAEFFGNRVDRIYDVGVAGIHRLFARLEQIRKAGVVIVIAGMEGALASVVGGLVTAPVIAVPTSVGYGANLGGLSALLSMLNSCANGVGVVNIDNGYGAACLASKINIGR